MSVIPLITLPLGSLDDSRAKNAFSRLKRSSVFQRQDSQNVVESALNEEINSESTFLRLPFEIRLHIYQLAFSRSPTESLRYIHHGCQPSPASALRLTCRQTREESQQYYHQSLIVNLWPHSRQDVSPYSIATMKKTPILRLWIESRNGIALLQHPSNIQQLALLISLKRESRTMCENFIEAEMIRKAQLKIKDLYIRVCICGALKWLQQTPKDLLSFSKALETFTSKFSTLERIHVLYCGQQWPAWIPAVGDIPFSELVLAVQEDKAVSSGDYFVRRGNTCVKPDVVEDSYQARAAIGLEVEDCKGSCRLKTVMTCNGTEEFKEPQHSRKWRHVEVNYYDSWTVLKEKCVRNEPRQQKLKAVPSESILVAKPTPLKRGITKVKDFVEAVPLGPTWGIHKYLPATRNAGETERGSHWRRY